MRLFLASSPNSPLHRAAASLLSSAGHTVYDSQQPAALVPAFTWSSIDRRSDRWTVEQFLTGLRHPHAVRAFQRDITQLAEADALVVLLPSGRSSHILLGHAAARGQQTYVVVMGRHCQPELYYSLATAVVEDLDALLAKLSGGHHG